MGDKETAIDIKEGFPPVTSPLLPKESKGYVPVPPPIQQPPPPKSPPDKGK
jgi:hypothetical protein